MTTLKINQINTIPRTVFHPIPYNNASKVNNINRHHCHYLTKLNNSSRGVGMNEGLAATPKGEGGGEKEDEGEEKESEDPLLDLVMSDIMGLGEEPVQSLEEVLR